MSATLPTANTPNVSITSFGAVGDGVTNNQAAIQSAFNYAAANGDAVYIPVGTFAYSGVLNADGIAVYGAGSSSILTSLDPNEAALTLTGNGGSISDLQMASSATTRLSPNNTAEILINGATNFAVENVLVNGSASVGIFNVGGQNGLIENNTVENTLADSISDIDGANTVTVQGNLIKNSGDDGISTVSYAGLPIVQNITVQDNTVLNNLFGRGISVVGGNSETITGNYVEGGPAGLAAVYISAEAGSLPTLGVANVTVSGNSLVNGGGSATGTGQGAITVYNAQGGTYSITGLTLRGNQIVNPRSQPIQFVGNGVETVSVINNTAYTTSSVLADNADPLAAVTQSGNQLLSPSQYATPLVSPGGGVGSGTTPTPTPTPTPTVTPSSNDTVVKAGSTAAITDAGGNKWTITSGGQVAVNGVADTITSNVIELAYVNGDVWQENASDLWWEKTSPTTSWSPSGGTTTSPLAVSTPTPTPSPDGTTILSPSALPIIDAQGDKWSLVPSTSAGWQIAENGKVDPVTNWVDLLQISHGNIVQENKWDGFYSEPSTTATSAWTRMAQPASIVSPDHLSLILSEDAWKGNAQFTVTVDGKQIGGPTSVTALHSQGATQEFDYGLNLAAGSHAVGVSFINDAWGGTASTDRNLYVNNVGFNGVSYLSGVHPLYSNGSVSVAVQDFK